MKAPRKKKKRKTSRPLEAVPLGTLVRSVKRDIEKEIKIGFSDKSKPN
jgi:hypothetical protein